MSPHPGLPPQAWSPAHRVARAFVAPIERFLAVEAASGLVLLAAAAAALIAANSPLHGAYEALWSTELRLGVGGWSFARDLRWWVDDGAMTLFFFLVGLEIRRELHAGELSELRRAVLPLAAALGGMALPAAIYAALNHGHAGAAGWGVPMATDIAFALGVLALLGDRVAPALRVLLLGLAVIDDLGAIVVIALFYSEGLAWQGFVLAGAGLAGVLGLRAVGVRAAWAYLAPALVVWAGAYAAGIHPTLAGVALGLLTPVTAWWGPERFALTAEETAAAVRTAARRGESDFVAPLATLAHAAREVVSPVERLLHALHGLVAFGVMPLFAFANAGVPLAGVQLDDGGWRVFVGVALGLVFGKLLGVVGAARLACALGLAAPPRGVAWSEVGVVGAVAGIGFTMALFVAGLAFPAGPLLDTARAAILAASVVAGVGGWLAGRVLLRRDPGEAASAAEAEASTER